MTQAATPTGTMPRQIPYIIANEACDPFDFYVCCLFLRPFCSTRLLLFMPTSDRAG